MCMHTSILKYMSISLNQCIKSANILEGSMRKFLAITLVAMLFLTGCGNSNATNKEQAKEKENPIKYH